MSRTASVHTELELRLLVAGGPALPVLAVLRYEAHDPWAVHVAFRAQGRNGDASPDVVVEWMFARQLLTEGMGARVGEGDVQVWPAPGHRSRIVHLAMASPSGSALFEIDREGLAEFLEQTYLSVPLGTEKEAVDLDAELALLLTD